ncbi:MAG: hypothetical protein AAFP19_20020 [Bacteroidota bacterium]
MIKVLFIIANLGVILAIIYLLCRLGAWPTFVATEVLKLLMTGLSSIALVNIITAPCASPFELIGWSLISIGLMSMC